MWKTGLKPRHASKGPPTLRKDANKALETHHTSEADAPTHQPKGGKNKKNQGGEASGATRARWPCQARGAVRSASIARIRGTLPQGRQPRGAERVRDCSLSSRGQVPLASAACNLCAAAGIKDGSHRPRLLALVNPRSVELGEGF